MLRTLSLPRELIRRSGKTVTMRIGRPIPAGEIARYTNPGELGRMLRNRVYALEANVPRNQPVPKTVGEQVPLLPPVPAELLQQETEALTPLFEAAKYQCFLADTDQIPNMMQEIGRRREESFRQVGEGTGSALDTDSFDTYYKHLILWDKEAGQLAGAYRLGIGREILERYGIKGFYTHSLLPLLGTIHCPAARVHRTGTFVPFGRIQKGSTAPDAADQRTVLHCT